MCHTLSNIPALILKRMQHLAIDKLGYGGAGQLWLLAQGGFPGAENQVLAFRVEAEKQIEAENRARRENIVAQMREQNEDAQRRGADPVTLVAPTRARSLERLMAPSSGFSLTQLMRQADRMPVRGGVPMAPYTREGYGEASLAWGVVIIDPVTEPLPPDLAALPVAAQMRGQIEDLDESLNAAIEDILRQANESPPERLVVERELVAV